MHAVAVADIDPAKLARVAELRQIFDEYPAGTLHAATDPKINLIWQDARTGLALRDDTYDVITTGRGQE